MHYLGEILTIFTLPDFKDIVIVAREATMNCLDRFPAGTIIELQNRFGEAMELSVESAELASQRGKDYLAFIIEERVDQKAAGAFETVWSSIHL